MAESKKSLFCHHCGKSFSNSVLLERHIQSVHEKLQTFECKQCNLKFKTVSNLKRHIVKKKMNKLELAQIWAGGHESKERVEMEKRRLKPLLTPMPLTMCSGAEGQKPISSY